MKWISVKDKLPEIFDRVIVARPYNAEEPLKVEQGYYQGNGWWKVYGCNVKRVRFWMPLPEPPKEETDG